MGGDTPDRQAAGGLQGLCRLLGLGALALGRHQEPRARGEVRGEALQLLGYHAPGLLGLGVGARRDVHQLQQGAAALHVFQEAVPQARALGSPLDQPRQVRQAQGAALPQVGDAEQGHEGCEGVVGHLRPGGGDRGEEGALAGVGQANQTHVSEQLEFQAQVPTLSRLARGRLARRLVDGVGEVHVAAPVGATAGHAEGHLGHGEVAQEVAPLSIVDEGADGHLEHEVLSAAAGALARSPAQAVARPVARTATDGEQGADALAGDEDHAPSVPTVSPVGAAARDVLLATEGDDPVATVPGDDLDRGFVAEHVSQAASGLAGSSYSALAGSTWTRRPLWKRTVPGVRAKSV